MFVFINKKNSGITLIELMISIMLSVSLLSLLLEIYVSYQRNYMLQKNLSIIQHNAKTITDLFRSEIHKAGNIGCAQLAADFPMTQYPPYLLSANDKLVAGKSELTVKYMAFPGVVLLDDMRNLSTLRVNMSIRYHAGDVMIVSSCFRAEIFVIDDVYIEKGMQIIKATHSLHHLYEQNAEVGLLEVNKFFIAKSRHGGKLMRSLYFEDIKHRKTELVEGVGNLLVEPSIDIYSAISGLQIHFDLNAATLHKTWYAYIALQGGVNANRV